jgi:hypothetical protein
LARNSGEFGQKFRQVWPENSIAGRKHLVLLNLWHSEKYSKKYLLLVPVISVKWQILIELILSA